MAAMKKTGKYAKDRSPAGISSGRPFRATMGRFALAFVTLLVGFGLLELGFRLTRRTPWYDRIVTEQATPVPYEQVLTIGEQRFRLRERLPERSKEKGTYRVLFLGDSFTFGAGIPEASRTFVELLGARWNAESPVPQISRYEVFNAGLEGSLTSHWVALFRQIVDVYEPDLVVTVFFLRDGTQDVPSIFQIRKIRRKMQELERKSWLFRFSYTYRFFREGQEQKKLAQEYLGQMGQGYLGSPAETQEWQRAQQNLRWISDQTRQRGAKFALVIFPVLFQLNEDYPLAAATEVIESFCRANGMAVYSLLPAFLGENAASLWVSPLDQHPNEKGHALAAEAMREFLSGIMK
jgi:hypothetical protein